MNINKCLQNKREKTFRSKNVYMFVNFETLTVSSSYNLLFFFENFIEVTVLLLENFEKECELKGSWMNEIKILDDTKS
jgi:hypothetical protein